MLKEDKGIHADKSLSLLLAWTPSSEVDLYILLLNVSSWVS